eukprot:363370_1
MQTTAISQHLSDLSTVDTTTRTKATKLLGEICDKILSNPSEPKYHDLNLANIQKKFNQCPSAISLLYDIGFKLSNDGLRLKWVQNETNSRLLLQLNKSLYLDPPSAYNGRVKAPNDLLSHIMVYGLTSFCTTPCYIQYNQSYMQLIQRIQAQNDHTQPAVQNFLDLCKIASRESLTEMKNLIELYPVRGDPRRLQIPIDVPNTSNSGEVTTPETISSVILIERIQDNDDVRFVDECFPGFDRSDFNQIGIMEDLLAIFDDAPQEDKNTLCIQESVASNTCTSGNPEGKQETDLDMVFQLAVSIMSQEGK